VLATLPYRISDFHSKIYRPGHAPIMPGWLSQVTFLRTVVYWLRCGDTGHRLPQTLGPERKATRQSNDGGTAISLVTAIPVVWVFQLRRLLAEAWAVMWIGLLFRHPRVSTGVRLRDSASPRVRYPGDRPSEPAICAGARRRTGCCAGLGAILYIDLMMNRQESLAHILQARGWIYAALGGLATVAYWRRRPWLEALDRRFFREHYNAQRLLRDVVEEIREARSFERVAPRVAARIESALHPEFVSLMVHEAGEASYRTVASAPARREPLPLAADSKLVALARVLGKPLKRCPRTRPGSSGACPTRRSIWCAVQASTCWSPSPPLSDSPTCSSCSHQAIRRAYTREDQEMLEAVAASLSLLFEQGAFRQSARLGVRGVPAVRHVLRIGLRPVRGRWRRADSRAFARMLANRYRLDGAGDAEAWGPCTRRQTGRWSGAWR